MPDRDRLLAEEAAGAVTLAGVFARIPPDRWADPTVTPEGWSPIIVAGHVAAWLDEATRVLTAMTNGSWDPAAEPKETAEAVAAMNAEQADRAAALTISGAEEAIAAARTRARAAWETLPAITPDAWSWFEESGPNHYAKHVHDLTAWLAGTASDPDVGALLQADAERWIPFAELLESVDPGVRDAEGWSTVAIAHHVVGWMLLAADVVGHNAGWGRLQTDEINARFLAESRARSFGDVRLEVEEARARLRATLTGLPEPTAGAKRAFHDSTVEHYEEHEPMLRRLTGSDGSVA
ncbi:MAG: hypothetical protein ABJB55_03430 [Actinomycetota bacterium]